MFRIADFLLSEVRLVKLCTASEFLLFSSICQIIFGGLGYSIASPWCAFKGLVVPWRPGSRPPNGTQLGSRRATLSRISDRDQEFPDCQCCSYGLWIMQLWIMDNGALILDNTIPLLLAALLEILASIGRIQSISGDCQNDFLYSVIVYLKEVPCPQTKNQTAISQK